MRSSSFGCGSIGRLCWQQVSRKPRWRGRWPETWVRRSVYVADSDEQAMEEALPAFQAERQHIKETRGRFNPADYPEYIPAPRPEASLPEDYLVAGTPRYVAEKIAEIGDVGCRNMLLGMTPGDLPRDKVEKSMRLFAEQVAPLFRND